MVVLLVHEVYVDGLQPYLPDGHCFFFTESTGHVSACRCCSVFFPVWNEKAVQLSKPWDVLVFFFVFFFVFFLQARDHRLGPGWLEDSLAFHRVT